MEWSPDRQNRAKMTIYGIANCKEENNISIQQNIVILAQHDSHGRHHFSIGTYMYLSCFKKQFIFPIFIYVLLKLFNRTKTSITNNQQLTSLRQRIHPNFAQLISLINLWIYSLYAKVNSSEDFALDCTSLIRYSVFYWSFAFNLFL